MLSVCWIVIEVTVFTEQPCEIVYFDGTESRLNSTHADRNRRQSEIWEVKAECEASQREFSTRTELLTTGLQRYGFTYRVVLDRELAKQPRPDNAKTLLRYGRRAASDNENEFVCGLALKGVLSFDVNSPFGPGTQFLERRNH
jgi:hypothetical protein